MDQEQDAPEGQGVVSAFQSAPVVTWGTPGAAIIASGPTAQLLVGDTWAKLIRREARVTTERRGWIVRVRVWWALSIKPGMWASPGFMDVPIHSYIAMRVRSWWRRKPLPRARTVQR